MARLSKYLSISLVVILSVSSLLMVNPVNAQTITNPSVPEFTLKYMVEPYYIPASTPTYTIDPYTGEQKIQTHGSPSQSGENRTIEIQIKNQQFTPYYDDEHNEIYLSFSVSYKGHFEDTWKDYSNQYGAGWSQSNSEYLTVIFGYFPSEGQIDFRVRTQIGYYYEYNMPWKATGFVGQSGDWSNTQTISIPDGKVTFSTSPSPTVPEFPITATLIAVLVVVSLLLIVDNRKQSLNH